MDQVMNEDQPVSMADKLAAINLARALFGPAAARKLWADFGLPYVGTAERADASRTNLKDRIVKLTANNTGMTFGVLVNRCKAFQRDEVESEVRALVSAGVLRSERLKGANGKTTERFIAN